MPSYYNSKSSEENICSKDHRKKKKSKSVNTATAQKSCTSHLEQKRVVPRRKKNNKKAQLSNYLVVLSQPAAVRGNINQQYFLVTNQPSANIHKNMIKTGLNNTGVFLKPLVINPKSKRAKNSLQSNPPSTSLGPGTLILTNTPLVSPQPQTLFPTLSNLLLNSVFGVLPKSLKAQEKENITTKSNVQTSVRYSNSKGLPIIKPKYCLTRTTQVNKVPIPAFTSRYANNYFLLNEAKTECIKPKETLKAKKLTKTEQTEESNKTNKRKPDKRKNVVEIEAANNSKKSKNDCTSDSLNEENCANVSNDHLNTTLTVSSSPTPPVEKNDAELNTTNKEPPKNEVDNSPNVPILNKKKEDSDIVVSKNNKADSEIISTTEKSSNPDIFEKKQEMLESVGHVNSQEILVTSATVTTTTSTTATTTATHSVIKNLELNFPHSELSNDIFASLQVPSGCQNPESTSPTAAFLLAFPLVSSGVKVTEVIDEENSESQRGTPTLLQIGTMDSTKTTQSQTETITSNLINLDSFSFFPSKDVCGSFYSNYSVTDSKANKTTIASTTLSTNSNLNTASVYVNVKRTCLPNSAVEPVKENCNTYDLKTVNPSKEIISSVNNCEKKNNNEKSENIDFNSHNQSSSKAISNYPVHSKDNQAHKNYDQKSQYIPPPYSNSSCNFNHRSDTTKICNTCSYVNISRNYTNPLYTNCSNYSYSYHPDSNFNQNYYKNIHRNETKTYYPLNYENYPDYRKSESGLTGGYYETSYVKEKKNNITKARTMNQNKLPVNWMTTPDNRLQNPECLLNSFSKGDFSQTYPFSSYVTSASTCFTTASTDVSDTSCIVEAKKCLDLPPPVSLNSHQRLDAEEKQFSWSPTKLPPFLDHPHNFVASTLPTLVGDLALGNPLPFGEQKNEYKYLKENKDLKHNSKISNYENQSHFLSVSQLVDHNKTDCVPARTSTRRNSGNRSRNVIQQKAKRSSKQENKELLSNCGISNDKVCQGLSNNCNVLSNNEVFSEQKNRSTTKNAASNYSAEALIGNQVSDESISKRYPASSSKSLGMTGFLTENIISYFPSADISQENYISQNQNYQTNNFGHNLCTSQNNTYSTNNFIYTTPTITSTYLATNNFDSGAQDYLQDNLVSNVTTKDKHYNNRNFNNRYPNKDEKSNHTMACSSNLKKAKKKQTIDSNTGLTNFEFPFLSLPGSNNSPILPDDFHIHTNFLPPTTPFSCKSSLYPKQNNDLSNSSVIPLHPMSRSNTQHPEISPSVGTSLTNFNLSTIFPEINKGPMTEMFPDSRIKENSHSKSCTSTSPQVPFNTEPKFSFST